MERKVGEIFDYEGKKLEVIESKSDGCAGCFFDEQHIPCSKNTLGYCGSEFRTDRKEVIFVEVQPQEQAEQQDEQPQKLNLCEILKNCPEGEPFWSPFLGDVKFYDINQKRNFIVISLESGETWKINADGTISFGTTTSPEIMLYPSKEQRDWSKVKYEPREKKFNPNTLKPFDKIIARIDENELWCCELFSFIEEGTNRIKGCGGYYKYCVPYNNDTMYLLNTVNEVPEYYRYWEK